MAATKAQINWSNVTWGSTPLTRISAGMFSLGGKVLKFKSDANIYPSVVAVVDLEPHASFTSADVYTFMNLVPGIYYTLTATLNDANLATGGAVIFTLSNAVFENADTQGQHAQFATVTGTWSAFSSDGSTPPLMFGRS